MGAAEGEERRREQQTLTARFQGSCSEKGSGGLTVAATDQSWTAHSAWPLLMPIAYSALTLRFFCWSRT